MTRKFFPNQWAKEGIGHWLLSQGKSQILFYLLIAFLPTQLGLHFWPNSSYVQGIRIDYLSPTIYFTDIIIAALFLTNLKFILKLKVLNINSLLFIFFLISIFIGVIYSKNQEAGTYGIVKLLEFSFLWFYVKNNIKTLNKKLFVTAICTGVLFESFLAIAQYFNQGSLGGIFYFFGERSFNSQTPGIANASLGGSLVLRPYSTFSHPNVLAGYLLTASLLVLAIKKYFHPILFVSTAVIFLTFGRVAIILWIFNVLFFLLRGIERRLVFKKINLIFFIVLVIFLFFIKSEIFLRFSNFNVTDVTVTQREEFARDSFAMFKESPIFGTGLNNYLVNLPFVNSSKNLLSLQPVHNIFLLVLSETGIIGFLFFCLFLIKTFIHLFKKQETNLIILLLTILIIGFFDHYFLTLQQGQIILALVFGLSYRNKLL